MAPAEQRVTAQAFARKGVAEAEGGTWYGPRSNPGCCMRSRDGSSCSGRRNAVWPLRSNRSGCGRSREVRRKRKEAHGRDPRAQRWMLHAFAGRAPRHERRNAMLSLRSNRSGVRAFARTAWRKRTGHVVGALSDRVSRVGPRMSGESIRPGNLRGYPCRTIVHKRRAGSAAAEPGTTLCDVPNAEEALEDQGGRGLTYAGWRRPRRWAVSR